MQSNLGQNTNTLAVPSLSFYETIYFIMLYDVKMCYFIKPYELNFITRIYFHMDPFSANIRITNSLYL